MDSATNPPATTKPLAPRQNAEVSHYAPDQIDKRSRELLTDVAGMSYKDLINVSEYELMQMPAQKVAYIRLMQKATAENADPRALDAFQNHHVGKAIQRVQMEVKTMTYQDLLNDKIQSEARFQAAQSEIVAQVISDAEEELDWSSVI